MLRVLDRTMCVQNFSCTFDFFFFFKMNLERSSSVPKKKFETGKTPPRASSQERSRRDSVICPLHNKKFEFFCSTCKRKLCPDCLFEEYTNKSKEHLNHKIDKLLNKVDEARKELENALKKVDEQTKLLDKETEKQKLVNQENEMKIEMFNVFRSIQKELEEKYQQVEQQSVTNANMLSSDIVEISKLISEASAILNTNDTCLLPTAEKLYQTISQYLQKDILDRTPSARFSLSTRILPPFIKHKDCITEYSKKREQFKDSDGYIYLDNFNMFGAVWRIKFYPNGNKRGKNSHVSVFLEVLKGFEGHYSFDYQVKIKHPQKKDFYERHFVSQFTDLDSWGWNRYHPIQSLLDNGFLGDDDTLHIVVKIRPSDYIVLTQIYANILEKEQKQYEELKAHAIQQGKKQREEKSPEKIPILQSEIVSYDDRPNINFY